MITFVGFQDRYEKALNSLLELEYEALEIYEAVINRLENRDYINKVTEFKKDHHRHVEILDELLTELNVKDKTKSPGGKQILEISKIMLKQVLGDRSILKTLHHAEMDTNTAYRRMLEHPEIEESHRQILIEMQDDEKKHKTWLEEEIYKG